MAVAVDAVSTASSVSSSGVTIATHTNLTVGAALSNGALIFGVAWDNAASSPTAHWDSTGTNQAMTLLGLHSNGTHPVIALFGLRNPTSGNKTFSTSWTTAAQATIFGISFTGVNQTNDATAFPNFNSATGTSTTPSVIITSAVGDITIGQIVTNTGTITSVNNTQLYIAANFAISAMNRGVGASTVTHSAVISGSNPWTIQGVDVAAAGFTLNPKQLIMM